MTASSWDFLDAFQPPLRPRPSFDPLNEWAELGSKVALERVQELPALRARWDDRLKELGGDPSRRDWSRFRPLRLNREEDWSNWLAELLESSKTGWVATKLLHRGTEPSFSMARPHVRRELALLEQRRRADLLLSWTDQVACFHVEVKIRDRQLRKTYETALAIEADEKRAGRKAEHFILLSDDLVEEWEELDHAHRASATSAGGGCLVHFFTWRDVVVALRQSLWMNREDLVWSAWACALVGAIENRILGIEHRKLEIARSPMSLAQTAHWASILLESIVEEE